MNKLKCEPLKKIILKNFTKENGKIFYSFEITPKNEFEIDFNELKIKPLFVDITWIRDHNLKYQNIQESPALAMRKSISSFTNVVNSLTCYKLNESHIEQLISISGNDRVLNFTILQGDVVDKNQSYKYANELISEIRRKTNTEDVTIFAAGYPGIDFEKLKQKVDSGVDVVLTQLTFSSGEFCSFVNDCRKCGISIPIIPGLYIPNNLDELNLLLKITKVSMPRALQETLEKFKSELNKFQDHSLSFIQNLIREIQENSQEHIRGFHFFTMNDLTMLSRLIAVINFSEA